MSRIRSAPLVWNTGLADVALSTRSFAVRLWREEFLWSATSFVVAGSAVAMAAAVLDRDEHWRAVLILAPLYLAFQICRLLSVRLQDRNRHRDELKRLQKERSLLLEREQAARISAEAADRLKDQFLATVSHELRTPMNAILGWADMLRLGALPADRKERACEAIFNNAKRQARLIEELLDMGRIMAGKIELDRTEVDPRTIANRAVATVQGGADAKRIQVGVSITGDVGSLHADGPRLQQVLASLLANAVKFTPEGGAVRLSIHRAGHVVEIVVSDSGIGIPRDFLPAVFEPFRQADGTPTREHDGLGLGLTIVKHVVDAHGGTISAASEGAGRGATFTIRLPQQAFSA
jgi:signal transduction histidine kinase